MDMQMGSPFFARVFGCHGPPRVLGEPELAACEIAERELLWIDLQAPEQTLLDRVWQCCGLPEGARSFLESGTSPAVENRGEFFWTRSIAITPGQDGELLSGGVLVCIAGKDRVITWHSGEIEFLRQLRCEAQGVAIGSLTAESFVATLLDRQLAGYFEAVNDFECAVEHLEADMSVNAVDRNIQELQRLRRWASRLRRMLAPHRAVFGALSRPDFRPSEDRQPERHFVALDTRFERAMDMIEDARELVIGSFELFSGQVALRTDGTMRVLTFVTVVAGVLATFVGALGMNFPARLFESGDLGFWGVVGGLLLFSAAVTLFARSRRWI